MKWIEWKNSVINVSHIKSIFWTQEHWHEKQCWTVNILMMDKEGKYAAEFESEQEARNEFERIKYQLTGVVKKR